MKLYNTLTQRVDKFVPRGKQVTLYVCGITPYDTTHLGHAFTYTSADILVRFLELGGLKVKYVQNLTDVDDDILRKAHEVNEDWRTLVDRWTEHYIRDMQNLNVLPPDVFPLATQTIPQMIKQIQKLLDAGQAYQNGGNVYYSINTWPEFGKLSHLNRQEMLPIANERGNHPDDVYKRDPLDFVLWQAQAPGEPAWDSPWGPGRPGWHIECSTMAREYLGDVVDVHGGGADLCFPHHEAEIAQVEPLTRKQPFVRFWFHTAMVRHDGEKMSKSLGNLVMVRNLLNFVSPDAIRLYLGRHHYRDAFSYDEGDLAKADRLADKIRKALAQSSGSAIELSSEPYWALFMQAMENDLNTPRAVEVIDDLAEEINQAALAKRDVREAQGALRQFGHVFGLRMDHSAADDRVVQGWKKILDKVTA